MKLLLAKVWEFIFGYDHRRWFPEKWDFSEVRVWEEYGGNKGFIPFYKSYHRSAKFVNGIDIHFYENSWKIKSIVGYTRSAVCSIAINRKLLSKSFKT